MVMLRGVAFLGVLVLPLAAQDRAASRDRDFAAMRGALPDAVAVVGQVPDPPAAARALLAALGPVPTDLPDEVRGLVGLGLTVAVGFLGGGLQEVLADLAPGGVVFGLMPGPGRPQLLALARVTQPDAAVARLVRFGQGLHSRLEGHHLLLADSAAGVQLLADRLALPGRWAADPGGIAPDALAGLWLDLDALRAAAPPDRRRVVDRMDAGGRFLLGPAAAAIDASRRVTVTVHAGASIRLRVHSDGGADGSPLAALLARGGSERTLPAPPPGTGVVLSLDRSLGALLAAPARFLPEAGVAGVDAFLSIADQLDGRTSFVDDLLGGLVEPFHVYLRMPTNAPAAGDLPLLLPEFAAVAGVADGRVLPILDRMAQLFTLIVNAERAQQNRFPFVTRRLRREGCSGLVAEPVEWRGPGAPPAEAAISPTLLFTDGHVILASTQAMALALQEQIRAGATVAARGDLLALSGAPAAEWIRRNRAVLAMARVLDEGEGENVSRRFVAAAAALAAAVQRLELRLQVDGGHAILELELWRAQR